MTKLSTIQTGVSGEYFVAAELSRRGFVASLTLRNTRGIDVLASNADATKSVGIQVKTCSGTKPDWILNKKAEVDLAENRHLLGSFAGKTRQVHHGVSGIVARAALRDKAERSQVGAGQGVGHAGHPANRRDDGAAGSG